ncbi:MULTISPECIES: phage portal protein [Streptomycetaceae]|nr:MULTISPECIES: phage portal protein [Streptomycetaceae]MYS57689.1 phage portal protein [Streptomyces sp. SID5468]
MTKTQVPGVGAGAQVYTAAQVAAMLNSISASPQIPGGFNPLPRTDPQVAFGPGLPLIPAQIDPVRQDTGRPEPRFNEYPVSANLPGITDRLVPWKVLRDAAAAGGIARRCIEIRKADIATLEWAITITKSAIAQAEADHPSMARADIEADLRKRLSPEIARCTAFWEQPDPGQDEEWPDWIGKLLEEHLVLDAVAIYPRRTYGGDLYALEILDGSTIKVLRDYRGGRPVPPQPAFQQHLWGFPRGEYVADVDPDGAVPDGYSADQLIYKRRNVRAFTPYGYSAVEQALEDLDVWLRRRQWIRAEFTDGAIPAGVLRNTAANGWTPQQVLEYETALNDAWSGQTLERHRLRILPPGFELESMADVAEKYRPEYDLFLLKQLASHFATTIAELNFTEPGGLGSSGYHEGQADIKERSATMPTYRWIQNLVTQISRRHLGMAPELEFRILGLESEDEAAADMVAQSRVQWGRMTLNEDRDRLGLPRYAFPEADMPMLMTTRGVVFLEGASEVAEPGELIGPVQAPPQDDADADGELDAPYGPDTDISNPATSGSDDDSEQTAAKKSQELAAYRRWIRRNATPARPFRFAYLTKADAPELDGAPVIFAAPGGDDRPKAGDPSPVWPGWDRDEATAAVWQPRIVRHLMAAVPADALAERWLARELVKTDTTDRTDPGQDGADSDEWAATLAAAFLTSEGIDLTGILAPLLNDLWTEGWAIGHAAARAIMSGRAKALYGWAVGDAADAARGLTAATRMALAVFRQQSAPLVRSIAAGRLAALGRVLGGARAGHQTAAQLAEALRDLLRDRSWAAMTAMTEVARAVLAAAVDAYRTGQVNACDWAIEPGACPACVANHQAGPLPLGAVWPTGDTQPPAHPRCRCALVPA